MVADNYYSDDFTAVDDVADGGRFYNHPPLQSPLMVGEAIFDKSEILEHTGVHQWYRWTIDPVDKNEVSVCNGDGFSDPTASFFDSDGDLDESLNPCQTGWYWSVINGRVPPLPDGDYCPLASGSSVLYGPSSATGCGGSPPYTCLAYSTPTTAAATVAAASGVELPPTTYSTTKIIVPEDADYLVFDYRFTNADGGPAYAAIFLDDVLLWQMQGDTVEQGVLYETSTLSLRGALGTRDLSVALFPAGDPDAAVEFSNFRFLTIPASCSFGVEALELTHLTVNASTTYQACLKIGASEMQIAGSGTEVTLEAGDEVVLGGGFSVEKGASLRVVVGSAPP